jgi:hypothetical protein
VDNEDWIMLTSKINDKWRQLLEKDSKATYVGQWVGFYYDGVEGLAFVVQCVEDSFVPL